MSTLMSTLARSLEAHLHHEGRRRGERLTRKRWTEEVDFPGRGQSLSDLEAGRMPDGHPRKLYAEALIRGEVEAGVAALEAELVGVFTGKTSGHVVKKLARLAARHLYGMEGGDR